ncbi:eIF2 kinase Gcn2p negative regulator [Tulasnella sp. 330]|nr:eIF2 kinase Gcn2p negative regulator [Tulasnella sp. 330]KAG8888406.1 eIF2 kinase Gcn2p negative regulator [Tulasnella sp. 332]
MEFDQQLFDFTARLRKEDPGREDVATELEALQSIYGVGSIRVWPSSRHNADAEASDSDPLRPVEWSLGEKVRFEVMTTLSDPHESAELRILVTLSATYPSKTSPQIQLLSRYVGDYSVDATIFGQVLRTYLARPGVEWSPGDVAIFDGIESVKSSLHEWYSDHLSKDLAQQMHREDLRPRDQTNQPLDGETEAETVSPAARETTGLPEGIALVEGEPILDRKSVFVGRACAITDPSQVRPIIEYLLTDRKIACAAHPVIHAWRCETNGILHQDNDDDGENAAGARLAHLLQILDLTQVLVIVTRYFGGIHLGADRFKHINAAARDAIERAGLLEDPAKKGRASKKK